MKGAGGSLSPLSAPTPSTWSGSSKRCPLGPTGSLRGVSRGPGPRGTSGGGAGRKSGQGLRKTLGAGRLPTPTPVPLPVPQPTQELAHLLVVFGTRQRHGCEGPVHAAVAVPAQHSLWAAVGPRLPEETAPACTAGKHCAGQPAGGGARRRGGGTPLTDGAEADFVGGGTNNCMGRGRGVVEAGRGRGGAS